MGEDGRLLSTWRKRKLILNFSTFVINHQRPSATSYHQLIPASVPHAPSQKSIKMFMQSSHLTHSRNRKTRYHNHIPSFPITFNTDLLAPQTTTTKITQSKSRSLRNRPGVSETSPECCGIQSQSTMSTIIRSGPRNRRCARPRSRRGIGARCSDTGGRYNDREIECFALRAHGVRKDITCTHTSTTN